MGATYANVALLGLALAVAAALLACQCAAQAPAPAPSAMGAPMSSPATPYDPDVTPAGRGIYVELMGASFSDGRRVWIEGHSNTSVLPRERQRSRKKNSGLCRRRCSNRSDTGS
ncbi:hypothetical protein TRIUR3_02042 [Triticum urartu]|uniref:Uncharacterized protein n=1 Tax=Triticum urartu TaxID=4572 RepID=M8AGJ3_TRIUA|nr:hypothetical protein TRIUR3_02042 [Triticum urartu]